MREFSENLYISAVILPKHWATLKHLLFLPCIAFERDLQICYNEYDDDKLVIVGSFAILYMIGGIL